MAERGCGTPAKSRSALCAAASRSPKAILEFAGLPNNHSILRSTGRSARWPEKGATALTPARLRIVGLIGSLVAIAAIFLAAPTSVRADERKCDVYTDAKSLLAYADAVWLGKVTKVIFKRASGASTIVEYEGTFWVRPETPLKGSPSRTAVLGRWSHFLIDDGQEAGKRPEPGEAYLIVKGRLGRDLYEARCVMGLP